ncbi:MAG: TonB-dependent receptor [Brumimicrobium sp.]|nr:TonB-dependent receptor [Brumimicrobium sp.]
MHTKITIIFYFLFLFQTFGQTLEGTIVDEESQRSVPFAKIGFPALELYTTSDSLGRFSFEGLPQTNTKLKVTAFDYTPYLRTIDLALTSTLTIRLKPSHTVFEEVTITASEGKLQRENITSTVYRSKERLFETGATNLGEALILIPGVQTSSVGMGISQPVVRGLSGMRVVTYWNGLRIENQQWGGDHGMGVSEAGLQGVEVIKGPSSLLYGADALGGVLHFIDEGYAPAGKMTGYGLTRFETNSMGTTNEIGIKLNKGKWRANFFANYVNHADFQLPDGHYIQNSRYWGTNFKTSIGYRYKNYVMNIRYQGSFNRLGIPGHSHEEIPEPEDFIRSEREREGTLPAQLIWNNFLLFENKLFFKRSDLLLQLGNTNNNLREFEDKVTIPFTYLNLNNSTYNLRYSIHVTEKFDLKTGVQGMLQFSRNEHPTQSYLIPDANTSDNGAYILAGYEYKKWRFQGGIRYDLRYIRSFQSAADSSVVANINNVSIERVYDNFNYSLGFVRNAENTTVRLNASSGFRAPHFAELQADGYHHGSLRYEKGDLDLIPEKAHQLDAALELHFEHLEIIFNPYFNYIENFIYLERLDELEGNYPVFQFSQAEYAFLYGGELGFHYHPHRLHQLHVESNFSLTIAEENSGRPLSLIPQPNSNSRLRYDVENKHAIQVKSIILEHQYFLPQNRVGNNETSTVDYHLLNLTVNTGLLKNPNWTASLGVRNALNTSYIGHLSSLKNIGLNQPGINFFGSVKYEFSKNVKNK